MKKTEHKVETFEFVFGANTESGFCSVRIGLEDLSPGERKFLFDTIRRTRESGSAALGLHETGPGEKTLQLLLREPISVEKSVTAAIVQSKMNGTHA